MEEQPVFGIDPQIDAVDTLGRYFQWSRWMERTFSKLLREYGPHPEAMGLPGHLYMSHWLASLYVVIEGWDGLKRAGNRYAHDPAINSLLESGKASILEDFRNSVYHFHPKYFSRKFKAFLDSPDNLKWALRVHEAFREFFNAFPRSKPIESPM